MVERQQREARELDAVFHSLADPTRRAMLGMLAAGERSVGCLAEPFSISLAAASKHIQSLERAGLIRREIRGRTHYCSLAPAALDEAVQWIEQCRTFWKERLMRLEQVLNEEDRLRDQEQPAAQAASGKRGRRGNSNNRRSGK